jgi:Co/Zn/Cd efflux system component
MYHILHALPPPPLLKTVVFVSFVFLSVVDWNGFDGWMAVFIRLIIGRS